MSTSIDNIWDEPVEQSPSRTARAQKSSPRRKDGDDSDDDMFSRPSKRSRSNLFLDGSDEEPDLPPRPSIQGNSEIDHLFDDLDDAPASTAARSSRRDTEPITASSPSRIPITSSSPPRDGLSSALDGGMDGPTKKRVMPKLDEERLLSKEGFPTLIKMCKEFKPKGKGHELSDLNRLFGVYQFWTHKMYPKMTFQDNVSRVEKLCHSKRMHAALSGWKDEWHRTINGIKYPQEDINMREDGGSEDEEEDRDVRKAAAAASSSRATSEGPEANPPSSGSEGDGIETPMATDDEDPFDVDIDAVLAMEEDMMKDSGARTASEGTAGPSKFKKPAENMDEFDFPDEEALWNELHGGDDLEMSTGQPQKPPQPVSGGDSRHDGDDEDMWEILAEMEKEQQASKGRLPRDGDNPSTPVKKKPVASSDDDWDDMYVTGDQLLGTF